MSRSEVASYTDLALPTIVATKTDVSRLLSELERVDNELTTATVRTKAGSEEVAHPSLSDDLTLFLERNEIRLDDTNIRTQLIQQLRLLKDKAPVVHLTFSASADPESLERVVSWFRESVHPQVVISAGVQPSLIAGVYMRTPNRIHDLSLRAKLRTSRDLLKKELEASRGR